MVAAEWSRRRDLPAGVALLTPARRARRVLLQRAYRANWKEVPMTKAATEITNLPVNDLNPILDMKTLRRLRKVC